MKQKIYLFALILCTIAGAAQAQGIKGKFKKIFGKDKTEETTVTIQLPAPYLSNNGEIILLDTLTLDYESEEEAFTHTLAYVLGLSEKGTYNIQQLDPATHTFQANVLTELTNANDKSYYYGRTLTCALNGKKLTIHTHNLSLITSNLFGDVKSTAFADLNLEKEKSIQQLQEFARIHQAVLAGWQQFVPETPLQPVTHWDTILEHEVAKGMNETECILSIGYPKYVRQSGNRTRWMIANNVAIIFEQGKVVNVVR